MPKQGTPFAASLALAAAAAFLAAGAPALGASHRLPAPHTGALDHAAPAAAALALTPRQRRRIERIIDDDRRAGESPIVARRRVLQVLTPQQRAELRAVTARR